MSGTTEPLSMTEFASELNITPKYLRDVCKRKNLQITAQPDPRNKSRKLLTLEQQCRIRVELGRNITGTDIRTPEQNTGTEVFTGELMLYNPDPLPNTHALAIQQQNSAEAGAIDMMLTAQMTDLDQNLSVFCAGIEAKVHQQVSRAFANGVSSGLNQSNSTVSTVGKLQALGSGGD
jgi:hypothetical protein